MKKILITGLSTIILLLLASCNSEENINDYSQFEGTVWKALISENVVSKPPGENYNVLAFYKNKKYSLSIADKNGVIIKRIYEGKYEIDGTTIVLYKNNERVNMFHYRPGEYKIFAWGYGNLIKQ